MKQIIGLFLILAAQSVFAAGPNQPVPLRSCGGWATLVQYGSSATLRLDNVRDCSNINVNGRQFKKEEIIQIDTHPGYNTVNVSLRSNSGAHADYETFYFNVDYPRPPAPRPPSRSYISLSNWGTTYARLPSCGGSVELKTVNGQVNLIFRNVAQCSNFDILANDGSPINYPNKKIQGPNGDRNGSFTLPQSVIDWGVNGVLVVVKSDSGIHADYIKATFVAW